MGNYQKIGFVNGNVLKAEDLNHIEEGIANAYIYTPATKDKIGAVMPGRGLQIEENGRLNYILDLDVNDLQAIQANVQAGNSPFLYPVGNQIIVPWKDMDDPAHNTDETAYQVEFDIVHHGKVELEDGRIVPGMYLQMHKASVYGVQFCNNYAFYYDEYNEGLLAGTYHIYFETNYDETFIADTYGSFTLTQNAPAGLTLCLSGQNVVVYASAEAGNPIETVPMTLGQNGKYLTQIRSLDIFQDTSTREVSPRTWIEWIQYGNSYWYISAIRQYLNSTGLNWFSSQDWFDMRPEQYNKHGFMTGFSQDFLNIIKPVKVSTIDPEPYRSSSPDSEFFPYDTFDTFFLPSLNQMNICISKTNDPMLGKEGDYFTYWRKRYGKDDFIVLDDIFSGTIEVPSNVFKTSTINGISPENIFLRTCMGDTDIITLTNSDTMFFNTIPANSSCHFWPVCVIC